jgi:hypothetical protein
MNACCFDFLADSLLEYAAIYSSAELIAAFHHIPGTTQNAALEASSQAATLPSDFFSVPNLTSLGFHAATGNLVPNVTINLSTCPAGIVYFGFRSHVDPKHHDSNLSSGVTH